MFILPLALAIAGIWIGRRVALARGVCPHRGKVWGAFLLPLACLPLPGLQFQALAVSLGAALAAGLTAHRSVQSTFLAVLVVGAAATAGVHFAGF
jgi:hypothetical protein